MKIKKKKRKKRKKNVEWLIDDCNVKNTTV